MTECRTHNPVVTGLIPVRWAIYSNVSICGWIWLIPPSLMRVNSTRGVQQPSKLKIAEFDSPYPLSPYRLSVRSTTFHVVELGSIPGRDARDIEDETLRWSNGLLIRKTGIVTQHSHQINVLFLLNIKWTNTCLKNKYFSHYEEYKIWLKDELAVIALLVLRI